MEVTKNKQGFRFSKKIVLIPVLLFVVFGLFYRLTVSNQKSGLIGQMTIKDNEINAHLDFLNKERFTEESKKPIREYIKREFIKYGYQVTEQNTGTFINLIADKGDIQKSYTLVGAHYDTVPDTVGMDDNASGVAALLAMAKYNKNPNIRFVAFDGEEINLAGSRYYVKNVSLKPGLVVVLETMGYYSDEPKTQTLPNLYDVAYPGIYNRLKSDQFRGNFSASICTDNAKSFCNNYESFGSNLELKIYTVNIPSSSLLRSFFVDLFRSDHAPFLLEGIPAVMITDTAEFRTPNYHKKSDGRNTVSANFIAKQANALLSAISK
jgi:Zn-dependent M28 family amino/carboxypeptidase